MGKGDKKSKRGKINMGTYGVRRRRKKIAAYVAPEAKPKKKTPAKKAAPKKTEAKKPTTKAAKK